MKVLRACLAHLTAGFIWLGAVAACSGDAATNPTAARAVSAAPAAATTLGGIPTANPCTKLTACTTLITERAFNCALPIECESDWAASGNFTIVQEPTAPTSGPNVGRITYPAGFVGGVGAASVFPRAFNARVLHLTAWIRFSPNFQNHSSGVNKILHIWIAGINRVVLMGRGPTLSSTVALQQIAAPYNNGQGLTSTSVHLSPNRIPSAAFTRGQWHRVDLVLTANTAGVANGSAMLFQNGVKVLEYDGIMYAPAGGNAAWESLNWNPTWGGLGDVVVSDMYMEMDHMILRGKN